MSDDFDEGFLGNGLSSLFGDLGSTPCVPHSGPALKLNYDDIAFTWNQQPSAPEAESRPVPPPQTRVPVRPHFCIYYPIFMHFSIFASCARHSDPNTATVA